MLAADSVAGKVDAPAPVAATPNSGTATTKAGDAERAAQVSAVIQQLRDAKSPDETSIADLAWRRIRPQPPAPIAPNTYPKTATSSVKFLIPDAPAKGKEIAEGAVDRESLKDRHPELVSGSLRIHDPIKRYLVSSKDLIEGSRLDAATPRDFLCYPVAVSGVGVAAVDYDTSRGQVTAIFFGPQRNLVEIINNLREDGRLPSGNYELRLISIDINIGVILWIKTEASGPDFICPVGTLYVHGIEQSNLYRAAEFMAYYTAYKKMESEFLQSLQNP